MSKRIKITKEFVKELIGNGLLECPDEVHKRSKVKFVCSQNDCDNIVTKSIETIRKSGPYCRGCVSKDSQDIDDVEETIDNSKTKYNLRYLVDLLIRSNHAAPVEVPKTLNRNSKITFKCSCGGAYYRHSKTFRSIEIYGAYCAVCTKKRMNNKIRETNLKKYGVEHTFDIIKK